MGVNKSGLRYLLCRPRGGLNDTLCQIERCWRYAEKYQRILVIDTRNSGLMGNFFDYFSVSKSSIPVRDFFVDDELDGFNQETCLPKCYAGKLEGVGAYFLNPEKNYVDKDHGESITFDFDSDHGEAILIHEQSGGGTLSFSCLQRLHLTEYVCGEALKAFEGLPKSYEAIHIRNTDYRSNYKYYFTKLKEKFKGKTVLVCSDDGGVIEYAKIFFADAKILSFSNGKNINGIPLHLKENYANNEDRKKATIDAIIDLLMLGGAKVFYYIGGKHGHPSGYSVLAAYLCNNKGVLRSLLKSDLVFNAASGRSKSIFLMPTRDRLLKMIPKFMRPLVKWVLNYPPEKLHQN
jgi:hypothetical protein